MTTDFDPAESDVTRGLRAAIQPSAADVAAAQARAGDAAAWTAAEVAWVHMSSPVGELLLAATDAGLVTVSYADRDGVLEHLASTVSPRVVEAPRTLAPMRRELEEHLAGHRQRFGMPLDWRLVRPGFTMRVLKATADVPFGAVATYREIAAAAGSPRGARAAGQALGSNPLPIVVPCHRILATGGGLGGYTSGLDRKRQLLAIEGVVVE